MSPVPKVIAVFGSSRPGPDDRHYTQAQLLGTELAAKGLVVCSGGYGGVMEAVSRGAKQAGGRTLGVTAACFGSRANQWVDEEIRVNTWQDRLFELIKRGHAYVACRGGTGTLVELAVVWEMLNKRAMAPKPLVTLGDFWQPVIERVAEAEAEPSGGPREHEARLVHATTSAAEAAAYLASYFAAHLEAR
jgi:uncharacterized protein (TIGR00730 family)